MSYEVREFIKNNWDSCIKENTKTDGTLIGMPYPYTVPAVGHFDEMYYWDTYFTNKGLDKYGYREEAHRIANKYVTLVDKVFAETGNLWEKYNVVEGNINVSNEYKMPAMMGWSAGTYLAALEYLKN